MAAVRGVLWLIVGIAPLASVAALIGTFFGLGGWGWLLFLWFGFTGMFSMGLAKQLDPRNAPEGSQVFTVVAAVVLLAAFVGGILFALSDLPERISIYYALFGFTMLILLWTLASGRRKQGQR